MSLSAGTRLGRYEILGPLGAGGMGEVYRARDRGLGREVAVKVLPEEVAQDPHRLQRFKQEARAASSLNHPNILDLHDIGTHEGAPYLVCELLEGETLRGRLREGPLPVGEAIGYGAQIARGLGAAHAKGIIHRDLKPENLFVMEDGRVKILDFGLAKLARAEPAIQRSDDTVTRNPSTESGAVVGTVGYVSPEQMRGHEVDHRSDIFAFRGGPVRDAVGAARVPRRDSRRDADGDPEGGSSGADPRGRRDPAGAREDRPSLPRQASRAALPLRGGPGVRPGGLRASLGHSSPRRGASTTRPSRPTAARSPSTPLDPATISSGCAPSTVRIATSCPTPKRAGRGAARPGPPTDGVWRSTPMSATSGTSSSPRPRAASSSR